MTSKGSARISRSSNRGLQSKTRTVGAACVFRELSEGQNACPHPSQPCILQHRSKCGQHAQWPKEGTCAGSLGQSGMVGMVQSTAGWVGLEVRTSFSRNAPGSTAPPLDRSRLPQLFAAWIFLLAFPLLCPFRFLIKIYPNWKISSPITAPRTISTLALWTVCPSVRASSGLGHSLLLALLSASCALSP